MTKKQQIGTDDRQLIDMAEAILALPDAKRMAVVEVLRMNMCMHCGGEHGCQCWNDE